ncbi:lipase family protein [Gorillibacterium massiliense]|uniref:lipase family protein n=1 Tax=Gorillibacterium massiliense TaxID=1280390 RepID=UPI0004B6070E|nr:lipase family protein [Gorillibacterium massiliense]
MGSKTEWEKRAIFLAAVCGQTYAQYANPDGSFIVPANYSPVHTIRAKSFLDDWEPFGFIIESPQEIIVAFRGTSSANDWISDVIASQMKFDPLGGNCLSHRGFTDIYSSTRNGIMSALAKLTSGKPLTVTGHSLGAALATLCAADIADNTGSNAPALFTFGSPRVGDPDFAKTFAKQVPESYRIANVFDIVTYVPPAVYKLPKREKTYYYQHIQAQSSLSFQNGDFGRNHVISSYFAELSKLQPEYTESLCLENPGFCPVTEEKPKKAEKSYAQ